MKWVTWVLVLALGWFQYSLWLSKGGWRDMWQLEQQVAARMELLVAESETPITKEDKINLKRAAKAMAAEKTDKVKAEAEELATLMNEIGL